MSQQPTNGFGFTNGQPFMSEFHGRAPWKSPAFIPENVMKWMGPNSVKPEDVIGWFTVPVEQHENIACQPYRQFICPCFWPCAVICFPCLAMQYCSVMKTLPTVTYIVTKKAVMQFKEDIGPCANLCKGGRDNTITHFDKMQAITSDNMENGMCVCATCCAVPKVSITLSTMHSTGGKHPRMVNDMVYVFCQDPDSSAAFLRSVMDEREDIIHGIGGHQKHVIIDGGGSSTPNITDQIRALDALRDDGILTDAEFDAKKTELLAKM
jgi:hypothetical protein